MNLRFPLCAWQRQIVEDDTFRYASLFACRRGGKTFAARYRILRQCLSKPGFKYFYITPFYSQSQTEYEILIGHPDLARFIKRQKLQPYPQIWFTNGSTVGFRSFQSSPQALRSAGLNEIWVDEIQDISDEAQFWMILRPLLSDPSQGDRGKLIVSGQFRGYNWYYNSLYLPGCPAMASEEYPCLPGVGDKSRRPNYKSWRIPPELALAYQGKKGRAELEDLRRQLSPPRFSQEVEVIPSANTCAVFDSQQIDRITTEVAVAEPQLGHSYIGGLDIGRVSDPSCLAIVDCDTGMLVYSERFELGMDYKDQGAKCANICRRYGRCLVVLDATGGGGGSQHVDDGIIELYRAALGGNTREFYLVGANQERLITQLSCEIQEQTFRIPSVFPELINELKAFEYRHRSGKYTFGAPQGSHDDHVFALGLALWGRKAGWAPAPGQYAGVPM